MRISDWSSDVCSSDLTVTGGDVRMAIRGLAPGESYMVMRNGADVSGAFERVSDSEAQGVVTGLRNGDNTVRATVEGDAGLRSASLTVRNQIGRAPSELQSLMRISYAVFCLKKKKQITPIIIRHISLRIELTSIDNSTK